MDSIEQEKEHRDRHQRLRRGLAWAAAGVVVLLLLALIPPLINVGRYQRRVLSSMSESLGRPVHLDRVVLHLLPMPSFTLENLVVSDAPEFGSEPIIRANSVEALLRVSSLWKRRVEFSRIRFVEPSVNLERNAQGRWNLEEVLVHASRVESAPTGQPKAGPVTRFPYIEATGGRINLKLGQEKMPFALTEADFALWLPTSQEWRVRIEGKPARTDTNIGDPGVVRLEGSLRRAAHMGEVPLDLRASWHDAPLGEASRLVTGEDWGWRGTFHVDAAIKGLLSGAELRINVTADELRRADFVPVQSLDVAANCSARADVTAAALGDVSCTVPTSGPDPVHFTAVSAGMQRPFARGARVAVQGLPVDWVAGWVRLFSPRVPSNPLIPGALDVELENSEEGSWSGTVEAALPLPAAHDAHAVAAASRDVPLNQKFTATVRAGGVQLAPTPVRLGSGGELTVSGQASRAGYSFTAVGEASAAQLAAIARAVPQVADSNGVMQLKGAAGNAVRPVAVTCSRAWSGGQMCGSPAPLRRLNGASGAKRRRR
ncbi:MAG TPA: AsmA family protein [Acidobacteriaceae bacterium]|nr:AsmA family protein [Acidobacteriaceae bacterium]